MGGTNKLNTVFHRARSSTIFRRTFSVSAAWDVAVSAVISLLPLLASGFVELRMATEDKAIVATLLKPMAGGQLFLYGFSILAAVFLIVNELEFKLLRKLILPITMCLMIVVGIYIGSNPSNVDIANRQLVVSSYYFYAFCLLVHYIAISFNRTLPPAIQTILDDGVDRLEKQTQATEARNA